MRVKSTKYEGVFFDPGYKRGRFSDGAWFFTYKGRTALGLTTNSKSSPFETEEDAATGRAKKLAELPVELLEDRRKNSPGKRKTAGYKGVYFAESYRTANFPKGAWFATVGRSTTGPFASEDEAKAARISANLGTKAG